MDRAILQLLQIWLREHGRRGSVKIVGTRIPRSLLQTVSLRNDCINKPGTIGNTMGMVT